MLKIKDIPISFRCIEDEKNYNGLLSFQEWESGSKFFYILSDCCDLNGNTAPKMKPYRFSWQVSENLQSINEIKTFLRCVNKISHSTEDYDYWSDPGAILVFDWPLSRINNICIKTDISQNYFKKIRI